MENLKDACMAVGVVAHACNLRSWDAEAGGSL